MSKRGTNTSEWHILLFFARHSLLYKRTLFLALFAPIGTICLSTLVPYYIGKLLAVLSVNPQQATNFLPILLVISLVGVIGHRIGMTNLFEHQARIIGRLQTLCIEVLLKQSSGFHNNRVAGKLVSDALDFPQSYSILSSALLVSLLPLSITMILGLILVMAQSWLLGLPLLGMLFILTVVTFMRSKQRRPLRDRRLVASKAVTAHLADTIINNQTVKTFAREAAEMQEHSKLNKTLQEYQISDWRSGGISGNNRIIGMVVFQLLFALVVIHVVSREPHLLGIGIFAFTYSITLSNNLFTVNNLVRQIEDAFLRASPFMEILNHTPSIQDKSDSKPLRVSKGAIHFHDVGFAYQDSSSQESVFDSLNLQIAAGDKIGLVGPSGGGKSTLTRLLLRFEDIQKGTITIDGQEIANVTQRSLREAIAYVPQEPLMFHRSVRENIAYGKLHAMDAEIIAAAKKANAHDFIQALPEGYDTLVGERGVKLSGGQRQRVAIARAILKDAPILVLDEATSALDSESEVLIQEALHKLMKGRTTLVIAHRLSTIQHMDRIIVLADGRISEAGAHRQLLQKDGLYAKLWKHQSGGFLED